MKWVCICFGFFGLPLSLAADGVDHLIADAEQLEQRGETDSAITVLKNAEHLSPENIQIEKLLARQYVLKVDDATDPAIKKRRRLPIKSRMIRKPKLNWPPPMENSAIWWMAKQKLSIPNWSTPRRQKRWSWIPAATSVI